MNIDQSQNQLGIDNLKLGLNFIANQVRSLYNLDQNQDGEVDTTEKIAYATRLIPAALSVVPAFPEMRDEARRGELTTEEIDELVTYAVTLDFLPPSKDDVEEFIRRFVLWVNYNRRFVEDAIDFFQRRQAA